MEKLWLRVHAPFATYSTFRAGTYRDTMPTMPPSAAYRNRRKTPSLQL